MSRRPTIPVVMVGVVEDLRDPVKLHRVRVRIRELHGTPEETPTDQLPWVKTVQVGGGAYDSGSAVAWTVGATVLVSFFYGEADSPIILGGIGKVATPDWKYGNPEGDGSLKTWSPPDEEADIPREAREEEPTVHVVYKTPKGSTISIEEKDGSEFIRVIDRAGQVLEFGCPVKVSENEAMASARGTDTALDNKALPYDKLEGAKAFVRVTDAAGQEIGLIAEQSKEKVEIKGCQRFQASIQKIILDQTTGDEHILIQDKEGQYVRIDAAKKTISIYCKGDRKDATDGNQAEEVVGERSTTATNWVVTAAANAKITAAILELLGSLVTLGSGGMIGVNPVVTGAPGGTHPFCYLTGIPIAGCPTVAAGP